MDSQLSAHVAALRQQAREQGLAVALNWGGKANGELVRFFMRGSRVPLATFGHVHEAQRWLKEGGVWRI